MRRRLHAFASSALAAWAGAGLLLAGLPWLVPDGYALTLLSQTCAMAVFALSYNLLLGRTGLLSFGHAIYAGCGGFAAAHALNWAGTHALWMPVLLVPLVGGLAGAALGATLGYLNTARGGTPFAMISLGLGELVYALAVMFPSLSGGEGGVSTDRVSNADGPWGITFGPDIEAYYLIACWSLLAAWLMHRLVHTPLGRMAAAVRDNAQRVGFVGFDSRQIRARMMVASSFFAGVAGALTVINVEIVTAASLGSLRSGEVLLAVVVGGSGFFLGPVLGAIVVSLCAVVLSRYTAAWQLYLGVMFAAVVLFSPTGLAGAAARLRSGAGARRVRRVWWRAATVTCLVAGALAVTEMVYALRHGEDGRLLAALTGVRWDAASWQAWACAGALLIAGAIGLARTRSRQLRRALHKVDVS